jgi:hypothetical protein
MKNPGVLFYQGKTIEWEYTVPAAVATTFQA